MLTRLAVLALLVSGLAAQELGPDTQEKVAALVEAAMEEQDLVGLAVSIGSDSSLVYTGCFGWADREAQLPVTPETRFRWASISKPLTAVVAMQLVEQGRLDLDADIRTLVPEFPAQDWPLTARQLLCHQGGIVHYSNGPVVRTVREYEVEHPYQDVVLALDTFRESPLVAEPGTTYSYTTHGYILLGAVVQRAGEQAFAAQVAERIAAPLGLASLEPDYQWLDLPHRAVGYRSNLLGKRVRSGNSDVSWKLPGGGFLSNVDDLARFGLGMVGDRLVERATRDQMWTAQKTRDGERTGYGLGFSINRRAGLVGHSGSQQKTATYLTMDPGSGVVVALMCNTEGARLGRLGRDILGLVRDAGE